MDKKLQHEILSNVLDVARAIGKFPSRNAYRTHPERKYSLEQIEAQWGSWSEFKRAAGYNEEEVEREPAKILVLDIETAPMLLWGYGMYDQNFSPAQIEQDGYLLSYAAKWLGEDEVIYRDQRNVKPMSNDRSLIADLRELLNKADIVVTQYGSKFDAPTINARITDYEIKPPASYKHLDTKTIAKKHFKLPSYGLEYMSHRFNKKHKKESHAEFPGIKLQLECMRGNPAAWDCMERYNKTDVLATEELYLVFRPWDGTVNFGVWSGSELCACGGEYVKVEGKPVYAASGMYTRYSCEKCGHEVRGKDNLLGKRSRASLLPPIKR